MTEKYTGKIVLVERANPTKEHSGYYDGSYLIWAETEHQLFGHKLESKGISVYALGASGSEGRLPLAGAAAFRIIAVDEPGEWVLEALDRVEAEIKAVHEGKLKARWADHVYAAAEAAIPNLRKALAPAQQDGHCDSIGVAVACPYDGSGPLDLEPPTVTVIVPVGVDVHVSHV